MSRRQREIFAHIGVRGSLPWIEWVESLCDELNISVAECVQRTVAMYAASHGHAIGPERLPRKRRRARERRPTARRAS